MPSPRLPVALLFYRRPESLRQLLDCLKEFYPSEKIFAISDGAPSPDSPVALAVEECRSLIEKPGWETVVEKNYAPKNMGAALRVSSGLSWAFSQCDRLIILEEDCLPSSDFFHFVERELNAHAENENFAQVSGFSYNESWAWRTPSATAPVHTTLSRFPHPWGWATTAKAWARFNSDNDDHLRWLQGRPANVSALLRRKWMQSLRENQKGGKFNSWFFRWFMTCLRQDLYCVRPSRCLVQNNGDRKHGAHIINAHPACRYPPYRGPVLALDPSPTAQRHAQRDDEFFESLNADPHTMLSLARHLWIYLHRQESENRLSFFAFRAGLRAVANGPESVMRKILRAVIFTGGSALARLTYIKWKLLTLF